MLIFCHRKSSTLQPYRLLIEWMTVWLPISNYICFSNLDLKNENKLFGGNSTCINFFTEEKINIAHWIIIQNLSFSSKDSYSGTPQSVSKFQWTDEDALNWRVNERVKNLTCVLNLKTAELKTSYQLLPGSRYI